MNRRGFTLLELIIVIVIVAAVAVLGIWVFGKWKEALVVQEAARDKAVVEAKAADAKAETNTKTDKIIDKALADLYTGQKAALENVEVTYSAEDFGHIHGKAMTLFRGDGEHKNRGKNIELVVLKLNDSTEARGYVLKPGEEFSFNEVIGPRTAETGFAEAPIIAFGEMVPGIGGGTCQTSSTMFKATLEAGLKATYRKAHSRPAAYINLGMDATVSYPEACNGKHKETTWNGKNKDCPAIDFRFKNPYSYPLLIRGVIETASAPGEADLLMAIEIVIFGAKESPIKEVRTAFTQYGHPNFKQITNRTNRWNSDRKKLRQAGRKGTHGALIVTTHTKDGAKSSRRIVSEYKPQHEIWEVGLKFPLDEKFPWHDD